MKKAMLFLFVIVSIYSCTKDDARSPAADVIKVGSILAYKINIYAANGSIFQTYDYTQTVLREEVISGNTWFVMVATIAGLGTDSGYIRKDATGYQIFENNVSQLYLKIPAAVNDTWTVNNSVGNYHNYTVKSLTQTVNVPKGAISCYYAETLDQANFLNKVWYNDTYIVVKLDAYDEPVPGTFVLQSTLELVSFTP